MSVEEEKKWGVGVNQSKQSKKNDSKNENDYKNGLSWNIGCIISSIIFILYILIFKFFGFSGENNIFCELNQFFYNPNIHSSSSLSSSSISWNDDESLKWLSSLASIAFAASASRCFIMLLFVTQQERPVIFCVILMNGIASFSHYFYAIELFPPIDSCYGRKIHTIRYAEWASLFFLITFAINKLNNMKKKLISDCFLHVFSVILNVTSLSCHLNWGNDNIITSDGHWKHRGIDSPNESWLTLKALIYSSNSYKISLLFFMLSCILHYRIIKKIYNEIRNAQMKKNGQDGFTTLFYVSISFKCSILLIFMIRIFGMFNLISYQNELLLKFILDFIIMFSFSNLLADSHLRVQSLESKFQEQLVLKDEANEAQRHFLRYVFHEIRVPLNTIRLGLESINLGVDDDDEIDEDTKMVVACMDEAANTMSDTLSDVLSYQKIEEGKIELNRNPFHVRNFINELGNDFYRKAKEKNINIKIMIDDNIPTHIFADELRTKQILNNFVSNAIKFSNQPGDLIVRVKYLDKKLRSPDIFEGKQYGANPDKTTFIKFSVQDQGIGIAPQDQKLLFKAFAQIRAGDVKADHGSGLGLCICHHVAKLMGGAIGVMSEKGLGSTFFFTLPEITITEAQENYGFMGNSFESFLTSQRSKSFDEDNDDGTSSLSSSSKTFPSKIKLIKKQSNNVSSSTTIQEERVKKEQNKSSTNSKDNKITEKNHIANASSSSFSETTAVSKTTSTSTPRTQVSNSTPTVRKNRSIKLLPTDDKKKDDKKDSSSKTTLSSTSPKLTNAPTTPGRNRDILVVDDVKLNRRLMKRVVEQLGFQCDEAEDGLLAVEKCNQKHYELVLMDNMMPNMTGVEATSVIRAKEEKYNEIANEIGTISSNSSSNSKKNKNMVIFGLTGNAISEDIDELKNAGCNEVLTKPLNFDLFLTLLKKYGVCEAKVIQAMLDDKKAKSSSSTPFKSSFDKKQKPSLLSSTSLTKTKIEQTTNETVKSKKESPPPPMLGSNPKHLRKSKSWSDSDKGGGSMSEGRSEPKILQRTVSSKSYREPVGESPTCLVVDDMKSNRKKMRRCMENLGFEVQEAEDGVVAVAHCENTTFSLVLIDNSMPNMTGVEATSVIREAQGENVVIFGVSTNDITEEMETFKDAGLNEVMAKPLHVPTFLRLLKKHGLNIPDDYETTEDESPCDEHGNMFPNNSADSPRTALMRNSDNSRRCLIVDDVSANRRMMRRCLEHLGFECDEAEDGVVALMLCQSRHYELVLMDNMMPNMSGAEATASMRASGDSKVIFGLTAHTLSSDLDSFKNAGCNEMLTKPLNFNSFKVLLDQYGLKSTSMASVIEDEKKDKQLLKQKIKSGESPASEPPEIVFPTSLPSQQSSSSSSSSISPASSPVSPGSSRPTPTPRIGTRISRSMSGRQMSLKEVEEATIEESAQNCFKCLVVDDVKISRRMMRRCLELLGWECEEAEDGKQAVEKCKKKIYSLVLMDNVMPNMTGVEAVNAIRKAGGERQVIFGITANALAEDMDEFKLAGCNEVLTKPLNFKNFKLLLDQYGIHGANPPPSQSSSSTSDAPPPPDSNTGGDRISSSSGGKLSSSSKIQPIRPAPVIEIDEIETPTNIIDGISSPLSQTTTTDITNSSEEKDKVSSSLPSFPAPLVSRKSQSSISEKLGTDIPIDQDILRCLVVDDVKLNRRMIKRCAELIGFKCDEACDGDQAIEKCNENHYHLILMDNVMPKRTGIEATQHIRSTQKN
jgi:CheY-like chemotaxis protein